MEPKQDEIPAPEVTTIPMNYDRTVVIGDLHGDVHAMLLSLADKNILHYEGRPETVLAAIRGSLDKEWSEELEALIIQQEQETQLIFLGDLLDRYKEGYHIMRFLAAIRWEQFGIVPVFIMGNHDLHNFHFFINPFMAHNIYMESEHPLEARLSYIGQMGLPDSLAGFRELHAREIMDIQRDFYKTGRLEWDLGYGKLTLNYKHDLSALCRYEGSSWGDVCRFCVRLAEHFGFEMDAETDSPLEDFLVRFNQWENGTNSPNWWFIEPDELGSDSSWREGYDPRLLYFNVFHEGGGDKDYQNLLFIDWRVISLVWRRHYGPFFRRFKQMHLDGKTLFAHGGLSPQAMIDSQAFGVLHRLSDNEFIDMSNQRRYSLERVVERANRLAQQIFENALNDFSFHRMNGAEMTDMIGACRGGRLGFTEFGGAFWSDYEYLQHMLRKPLIRDMYTRFLDATGIRRVICGHTRFEDFEDDTTRYLKIKGLQELGLDYICVDNSCSRGYRSHSIACGIEINRDGEISDPGKFSIW